jgi:hypothetical protein
MIAAELQVGLSKVMAKYEISKCAASLKMITDGLFFDGAISEEVYELFNQRYQRKLVEIAKEGRENSHIPKLELEKQKREQCQVGAQKIREKERLEGAAVALKGMCEQWDLHTDLAWRMRTVTFAKKYPDNEFAKLIIVKEKDCDIISQGERVLDGK